MKYSISLCLDYFEPAPFRGGRAHLWKCPFHNEQKGYSLAVWANGYRCFGACDLCGDAIDWLMNYRHLSFIEATALLDERPRSHPPHSIKQVLKTPSEPPEWGWQHRAEAVVHQAEETLWSDMGEPALNYLINRGLNTRTIREARLGYVAGDHRQWRMIEGMDVPCGITIPWFASGSLWAVKVRRAGGAPKYQQIKGGNINGLYGADRVVQRDIALFCEGEFDALLVQQEAGEIVAPVTLSSATAILSSRWYAELTHFPTILIAYDRDVAGQKGAKRLLSLSPRFRQVAIPHGKDVTEFYLRGGDIYSWIANILSPTHQEVVP